MLICFCKIDYKTFINRNIEINWRKDGQPISEEHAEIDFDHLTVQLNSASDLGLYSCQVVDFDNEIESDISQVVIQKGLSWQT